MLNEVVSYIEQCEASKPLVRPHLNPLHKPALSARTPPVLVLLLYTLSTSCLPPKQARPSPPTPSRNPGHYGALSLTHPLCLQYEVLPSCTRFIETPADLRYFLLLLLTRVYDNTFHQSQ